MRIEELAELTSDLVNEGKGREKVVIDIGETLKVLEEQLTEALDSVEPDTAENDPDVLREDFKALKEEVRMALNNFIHDEKEQEVDALYDRGRLNLPTTYDY